MYPVTKNSNSYVVLAGFARNSVSNEPDEDLKDYVI